MPSKQWEATPKEYPNSWRLGGALDWTTRQVWLIGPKEGQYPILTDYQSYGSSIYIRLPRIGELCLA